VTSDERPWFDKDRKRQSLSLDTKAEKYYRDFWDVGQVRSLESGQLEYARDDNQKSTLELFDCAGIDVLLYAEDRYITVAQRWRPQDEQYDVDFSLRAENGSQSTSAFEKHLTSYGQYGVYPSVYAFGVYDSGSFDEFYLIDGRQLLGAYDDGDLPTQSYGEKSDGTMAKYVAIDDLEAMGCIIESWDGWRS